MKKQMTFNIASFEELDGALLQVGKLDTEITSKEADMNAEIQKIKDSYSKQTEDARAKKELISKSIESFCLINKGEFEKSRSKEFLHGKVGFRTNPPKVTQLNKKYSVATTLELLKKIFKKNLYIRTKDEIDKEAILADYAAKTIDDTKLASVGLKVDQEDSFYCEINWESLQNGEAA